MEHVPGTMQLDNPVCPPHLMEALAAAMMTAGPWHALEDPQRQELRALAEQLLSIFERQLGKVMVMRQLEGVHGAVAAFTESSDAFRLHVSKAATTGSLHPQVLDGVDAFLAQLYAWWLVETRGS